ncbi:glycosyltransferase [Candidatus Pelagibacter communis]|jgi:glycosyltransferase involved in cell wall biosynthesis|uniref:glycosyltransferase n=1 Tax=Pelagibacter ubique TaxID=198252 RepID=UPI00036544F2|nr:glycosyltransferase [Candidatus Pelagibacter ubique]
MKISVLLPYKENYAKSYAGAVSLFINDTVKLSKFKKNIRIYGSTTYKQLLSKNYTNIELNENSLFQSRSRFYVNKFIELQKKINPDIIEIHNRPIYLKYIKKLKTKIVLYFHNDPLAMTGSRTISERISLLEICKKIIFNSKWTKEQFIKGLDNFYSSSSKLEIINQSTNKPKIDFTKKKKIITFIGKLNSAKGYDLFGSAILKILRKHKDWSSLVIGDEHREKLIFKHKNLKLLGFQQHRKVLEILEKTSISVACSKWEEPFGRTSLEASSRGCAVIISNKGGLKETITNGVILKNNSIKDIFNEIDKLIKNKKRLLNLQKQSYQNFYLTNQYTSKKIDFYRTNLINFKIKKNNIKISKSRLKIIHITNFNERHNGRLFFNTGRRINNGLIRLGHSVLEFSDRDIVSYHRKLNDFNGSKYLNKKLLSVVGNYNPDLIILGHADLINIETLRIIKNFYPQVKISQWFLDKMDSTWKFNKKRFLEKIDIMEASFCTTYPDILNFPKKNKIHYLPNPVDESFEVLHNYKYKNLKNDVFFAMSHGVHRGVLKKGKFDERENFINKLTNKISNIKFDLYGIDNKQPIWADNFIKSLSQSKIALNLSQGSTSKYYTSDRFAQLIGNGLLVLIDKKTKLSDFFNKDEIITYSDINDLSNKIKKYSMNDSLRQNIARKGREKYFKFFNSTIVAEFIINKSFNINKKYFWENNKNYN